MEEKGVEADWKKTVLAHWELINKMAARRFGSSSLAEEAALFVLEKLQEDDWRRLRAFGGRSSLATFLRSLTFRLLEDFSRKRFGRVQAPPWVRRLGGIWLLAYTFVCLERLSIAEAMERCAQMPAMPAVPVIERTCLEIKARIPGCGKHQMLEVHFEESDASPLSDGSGPEQRLDRRQRLELLKAVFAGVAGAETDGDSVYGDLAHLHFDLGTRERLLIRLRYVDGLSVSRIAALLEQSRHQVNGQLRRMHKKLRRVMEKNGLADEALVQLAEE